MIAKPGGWVFFSCQVKLSSHHPGSVFPEIFDIVLAGHVSNLTNGLFKNQVFRPPTGHPFLGIRNFMAFPKEQLQSTREDFHRSFLESQVFPKTQPVPADGWGVFVPKKLLAWPPCLRWFLHVDMICFWGGWWKAIFPASMLFEQKKDAV